MIYNISFPHHCRFLINLLHGFFVLNYTLKKITKHNVIRKQNLMFKIERMLRNLD